MGKPIVRKIASGIICVALCLALAGCGDGPKEKVVGVWKSETVSMLTGLPEFLVIEADKLGNGRDETIDIVIEEKDGKAVIRKAGMDQALLIITVADDKSSISVNSQGFGGAAKFVASSGEELRDTFTPSPDKIVGIWKRGHSLDETQYYSILELTKNSLQYNGQEEAIEIQSDGGAYRFKGSELLPGHWTLDGDGSLRSGNALTGIAIFTRSSADEAKELIAARDKLPERVVGIWREERRSGGFGQPGTFDSPTFHEITPTEMATTRNGVTTRQAIDLSLTDKGIAITLPDGRVDIIATMRGSDAMDFSRPGSMFGPDTSLVRVTAEQRDQSLSSYAAAGEAVVGVWKKQSGRDLPDHPFLVVTDTTLSLSGREERVTLTGKGNGITARGEKHEFSLIPTEKGLTLRGDSLSYAESGDYARSSAEEMKRELDELAALPDSITGYWRSRRGIRDARNYRPLAITRDSLVHSGKVYPATITPQRDGRFVLGDDAGKRAEVTPQKDGSIYFTPAQGQGENYVAVTQAEYEALMGGRQIFPREFQGYWLGERERDNKLSTFFLRAGDSIRNGFREAIQTYPDGDSLVIVREDNPNYQIASITLQNDGSRLRARFERGSASYRRVEREEFEAAYKLNFFAPELVWGHWITDAVGGRKNRPAALVFSPGKENGLPVQVNAFGFAKKNAPDSPLDGYFDINADGTILIRGGADFKRIFMEFELKDRNTLEVQSSFHNGKATFTRANEKQVQELQSGQ